MPIGPITEGKVGHYRAGSHVDGRGLMLVVKPSGTRSWLLRYQLKGPPNISLTELKTLQDWVVERRLRTVPG